MEKSLISFPRMSHRSLWGALQPACSNDGVRAVASGSFRTPDYAARAESKTLSLAFNFFACYFRRVRLSPRAAVTA